MKLPPDFEEFLLTSGKIISYDKSKYVFRQGDRNPNAYFVAKGLLKAYYLTREGKEFVKSFLIENDFIASLTSAFKKEPCSFNLLCLEKCELISINLDSLQKEALSNLEIAGTVISFLISLAMKKEKREYEFLCMNPEERYKLIQKENPGLLNRVKQNDIAHYLGITPVALSRIRNRISG